MALLQPSALTDGAALLLSAGWRCGRGGHVVARPGARPSLRRRQARARPRRPHAAPPPTSRPCPHPRLRPRLFRRPARLTRCDFPSIFFCRSVISHCFILRFPGDRPFWGAQMAERTALGLDIAPTGGKSRQHTHVILWVYLDRLRVISGSIARHCLWRPGLDC